MLSPQYRLSAEWVLDAEIAELVRRKARQLSRLREFNQSDLPDLEQELTLELVKKFSRFDPDRAKAKTFASRIIESKSASLVRAVRAEKRAHRRNVLSLNDTVRDHEGKTVEIAQTFEESAGRKHTGQRRRSEGELTQMRIDIAEVNRTLSPPLRDVAALISHVPEYAVSQVLGMSRRQTASHVAVLRELYEARGMAPC